MLVHILTHSRRLHQIQKIWFVYTLDPDPDWYAIWCPGPDDPDSYTTCNFSRGSGGVTCYDKYKSVIL